MSTASPHITRFYTKQEVAQILRVTVRTVTNYMARGLPYRKIHGTVRIPEDKFREWIEEKVKL
jgi:excisionase family DNA binding protein